MVQGERKRSMLERVSAEDGLARDYHGDSVDTLDSAQGAAATTVGMPPTRAVPPIGDITLPSPSVPAHRPTDQDSRATPSSADSKLTAETSTLPIRGTRSPPGTVHQLLAAGPADSVRDTAGKPVRSVGNWT